ncbi:DNA primase, partial [Pasteurella multocida subsp. multocida str. Anand1_cattle]
AKTDIVELVNSRVKLQKAGRDYQACCPFHQRKDAFLLRLVQKNSFIIALAVVHTVMQSRFLMEYDKT